MKIQGTLNGQTVEIEVPDGAYVAADSVSNDYVPKTFVELEIKRRASGMAKKQIAELTSTPEKKAEFLKTLGIEPGAPATGKAGDLQEQLKQAQAAWEREHLTPAQQKNEALSKRVQKLLGNKMERDILAAAAEIGIKKEFLQPLSPGAPAPFVEMVGKLFGFNEEHDDFFVRNGEDWAYSANPAEAKVPYKTIGEYLTKDFIKTPQAKMFLTDDRQRGAGLQGAGRGSQTGNVVLTATDARDPAKYRAAKADAEKRGVQIEIEA
jgi:hypothetical protein